MAFAAVWLDCDPAEQAIDALCAWREFGDVDAHVRPFGHVGQRKAVKPTLRRQHVQHV
jgi:hypothetical protein